MNVSLSPTRLCHLPWTIVIIPQYSQYFENWNYYCGMSELARGRNVIFAMENCPVTSKDKFKLETAIDDFNLCTLRVLGRFLTKKKVFFSAMRKTFVPFRSCWGNFFFFFILFKAKIAFNQKFEREREKNLNSFNNFPQLTIIYHNNSTIVWHLYACNVTTRLTTSQNDDAWESASQKVVKINNKCGNNWNVCLNTIQVECEKKNRNFSLFKKKHLK